MLDFRMARHLSIFLCFCALATKVQAEDISNIIGERTVEYCTLIQPLNRSNVVTNCDGGFVSVERNDKGSLVKIGAKHPNGTPYRFHRRLDAELAKKRFEALHKVAIRCFVTSYCDDLSKWMKGDANGHEHWHCKGRFLAIELEQLLGFDNFYTPVGKRRNLYLCLEGDDVRGIVAPFFRHAKIKSRPNLNLDDHAFAYFEIKAME